MASMASPNDDLGVETGGTEWRRPRSAATIETMRGPCRSRERLDRYRAWLAGAILLVAPACSSADHASDPASTDSNTLPQPVACADQRALSGSYRVPVSTELEPYASFDLNDIEFCMESGAVRLDYDLPELLVGRSEKVRMSGAYTRSAASLDLDSGLGTASCRVADGLWLCRETLHGVSVDASKLDERFAGLPPEEARARNQVAEIFSSDPIGIVSFAAE